MVALSVTMKEDEHNFHCGPDTLTMYNHDQDQFQAQDLQEIKNENTEFLTK